MDREANVEAANMESVRRGMVLAHYAQGRDNNFNLIRMLAAAGVLVSHAFPLALGRGAYGRP